MKVLLMGHPNVGKSVVFSRLTGTNAVSSNYPGTTVDYLKGSMRLDGQDIELIDVPGTFSLQPHDRAEEVAVRMLHENQDAIIICVIDATKTSRGLFLALDLIEQGYPIVVSLNMWDIAEDKNISIDTVRLSTLLGCPVMPTVAVSAEGLSSLVAKLKEAKPGDIKTPLSAIRVAKLMEGHSCANCQGCLLGAQPEIPAHLSADERWALVEEITSRTVTTGRYRHTIIDAIGDYTVKPLTGIPFALAMLYAFWSIFTAFSGLITDGFMVKLFDHRWLPWMQAHFPGGPGNLFYSILVDVGANPGGVYVPSTTCLEAFGMLTSGLYLEIGVILPALFIFYIMLALLEDIGYMPRLAVLMDTFLHKIGLHGYAIVPTILSLGCNVPGIAATRILETKKQRFMMMSLLAFFIPCGAQLCIMHNVVPQYTGFIMAYLFLGYFTFGFLLNKIIPGYAPEVIIDIPVYQRPRLSDTRKKVWLRTKEFLKDAIPMVMLGILIVNLLFVWGAIDTMAKVAEPVFSFWFGLPGETAGPLISAFLRKDLAIAQLSKIAMSPYQLITAIVLISVYFPCIGTVLMMIREGGRTFFGSMLVQLAVAFGWAGLLHVFWIALGVPG